MGGLEKTDFYDLVERIKDSFMEIDSDIMVDLEKTGRGLCQYVPGAGRDGEQVSVYFGSDRREREPSALQTEEHEIVRQYHEQDV